MVKIRYSAVAIRDLEQIGDYIAGNLKNPAAALNTVRKIQNAIDNLADFPNIGTPLSPVSEECADYRFLICGNYLVFYRPQTAEVYIDRILYSKRDYLSILFDEFLETET